MVGRHVIFELAVDPNEMYVQPSDTENVFVQIGTLQASDGYEYVATIMSYNGFCFGDKIVPTQPTDSPGEPKRKQRAKEKRLGLAKLGCNLGKYLSGDFCVHLDDLEQTLRTSNRLRVSYTKALAQAVHAYTLCRTLTDIVEPRTGWLVPYAPEPAYLSDLCRRAQVVDDEKREVILDWQERAKILQAGLHAVKVMQEVYASLYYRARHFEKIASAKPSKKLLRRHQKHA